LHTIIATAIPAWNSKADLIVSHGVQADACAFELDNIAHRCRQANLAPLKVQIGQRCVEAPGLPPNE
jgi:hypothetical protein